MIDTNDNIVKLIEPVLAQMGYEVLGVQYNGSGKYSVLRVYIDRDTGIFVADCEAASKQISAILDVEDPISGQYSLEVSSPGIERPLFTMAHYQRFLGSMVRLKLNEPYLGQRKLVGCIAKVSNTNNNIEINTELASVMVDFDNIYNANLVVDF